MNTKIAIAGLRHGHILSLIKDVDARDDVDCVAIGEEDGAARDAARQANDLTVTHHNIDNLLSDVDCDAVAIGDYYGKRGSIAMRALQSGRHVILDKPICTSLEELEQMRTLAGDNDLRIGCMLDLRDAAAMLTLRREVQSGLIGDVHALFFGGQHPLMPDTRAGWYFEEEKHGGTLNDIAIHGLDAVSWLTGHAITRIDAARCWNALPGAGPHMKECGQCMCTLANGAGLVADVSYLMPETQGYSHPYYWRFTLWGEKGILETSLNMEGVIASLAGESKPRTIPFGDGRPGGYLQDFLDDVRGNPPAGGLDTATVLRSARATLTAQHAADQGLSALALVE